MNKLTHLGIIADGNGRWAEQRGLPRTDGHEAGLHNLEQLVEWCARREIPVLSVYVFSYENWNRPQEETENLMQLAEKYFDRFMEFKENNIKVVVSGTSEKGSREMLEKIRRLQEETKDCTGMVLNLCANYSGRKEIIEAIAKGAKTEEEMDAAMYQNLPPLDLVIRTGGKQRLSNFLLWQSAYAELAFSHTLFPDFSKVELRHIISTYEKEQRNFGGVIVDKR